MPERIAKIRIEADGAQKAVAEYRSMFEQIRKEADKTSAYLKNAFKQGVNSGAEGNSARKCGRGSSDSDAEQKKAMQDIRRLERERLRIAEENDKARLASSKALTRAMVAEVAARNKAEIASLKQIEREAAIAAKAVKTSFSDAFKGGFIGSALGGLIPSIAQITAQIPSLITDTFNKGLNFQQMTNGLAAVTGSASVAQEKIQELVKVSQQTPGLTFSSAVEGQTKLEAVGFEAAQATEILSKLANVRILSGASKQDYDAVVFNLSQIRAMGKLTGDELRETITRIPYMARVVKDVFGTLNTKDIAALGLTSDEFFAKLLAGLGEVPQAASTAGLAVENLQDSFERYQIGVGTVLSTNPEIIALLQTLSTEINESGKGFAYTDERVKEAETSLNGYLNTTEGTVEPINNQGRALSETTTSLSELVLKAEIFATRFDAVMKAAQIRTNELADAMRLLTRTVVAGLYELVNSVVVVPVNSAIESLNNLISIAKQIPGIDLLSPVLGGLSKGNIVIPKLRQDEPESLSDILQEDRRNSIKANLDVADVMRSADNRIRTLNENFDKFRKENIEGQRKAAAYREANKKILDSLKNQGTGGAGGGDKKEKQSTNYLRDLEQLALESGFKPGSGFRKQVYNQGSVHGSFKALDVSVKANPKKTIDDYTRYIIAGIEKGYRAVDERLVGYFPGIKSTGANVHLEKGAGKKSSLFLPQSYYSVPVAYLQELDEKRRGKGASGYSDSDIENFKKRESDTATKNERERITRALFEAYKTTGLLPDQDFIRDFTTLLADEARSGKNVGLGAGIQPEVADTLRLYFKNAIAPAGLSEQPIIERQLEGRDKFLQSLEEEYNVGKRISALKTRNENLDLEILARAADYETALEEQETETRVLLALEKARNIEAEARNAFSDSVVAQIAAQGNLERDLSVLRKQNADAEFIARRRSLSAGQEMFSLEQEIAGLRDRIANGGINESLEIEAARLQDIVDLRGEELDAVISINRSQMTIDRQMEVSSNKIRAKVLENLASQKTMNQSIADGIISIYDKAASGMDKLLDRAGIGKIPILGDIAKAQGRNVLTNITRSLMDKFLPPEVAEQLKKTGNPVVDTIQESNTYLKQIVANTGGGAGVANKLFGFGAGAGGGSLGTLLAAALSSGAIGSGAGAGAIGAPQGDLMRTILLPDGTTAVASAGSGTSGGGFFGNLKNIFSNKPGGIFAPLGGAKAGAAGAGAGIAAGAGQLAAIAGGLIGGRTGSFLSNIGSGIATGAQIGAMFGGGVGAAIGAAIGGGIGLVQSIMAGDPKRKKDKKENLPALQQGFTDALQQLRQLVVDTKSFRVSGDSAIEKATELRSQIASGFGIQFESKKYKQQAQTLIAARLTEADALIEQIRRAADISNAATARQNRLIPEFADGGSVSSFFAGNFAGLVPGAYDRRDNKLIRVSGNEVVLTPAHWQPIAPYLKAQGVPGFASGGTVAGKIEVAAPAINMTLNLYEKEEGGFDAFLDSDNGQRQLKVAVNRLKRKGDL